MTKQDFKMGVAMRDENGLIGYVVEVVTPNHKKSIWGANGLQEITFEVQTAYSGDEPKLVLIDEHDAKEQLNNAFKRNDKPVTPARVFDIVEAATKRAEAQKAARIQAMKDTEERQKAHAAEIAPKIPSTAKAVILARRHIDKSDSQSDYWGYDIAETIVLGFSTHTRNLFPELRKAATNAPETEHLSTRPDEEYPKDEHRENYSMGGGTYLGVYRNSDGWVIRKEELRTDASNIPVGARWAEQKKTTPKRSTSNTVVGVQGYSLREWLHTKKNVNIYIIEMHERVQRDEFTALRNSAKQNGGWYSRAYQGSPAGFAFETREAAHSWAQDMFSDTSQMTDGDSENAPIVARQSVVKVADSDKLRTMADKLQSDIDNKRADRQENTAKRQAEAQYARTEADRLERTQQVMRALAHMIDNGTLPENLTKFKSKKSVYESMAAKRGGMVQNGYHSYNTYEDAPSESLDDDQKQLWDYVGGKSEEIIAAEKLKACLNTVKGSKIEGYFPTPDAVLDVVMQQANIQQWHNVLEPTAGDGAMIRRINTVLTVGDVVGFEVNHTLWDICQQQGFDVVQADFTTVEPYDLLMVDRVVMNPPFERLQDCDLVQHAFKFLKPQGVLVAVMSPSWQHNSQRKAAEFREWLGIADDIDTYTVQDLDAGAFKESGTNISTIVLTIHKA